MKCGWSKVSKKLCFGNSLSTSGTVRPTRFWLLFGSRTALPSLCNSFQRAVKFWTSASGVSPGKLLLLGLLQNSRSLFYNAIFTPCRVSFHFLSSSFCCKTVIFIVSLSRDGNGFGLFRIIWYCSHRHIGGMHNSRQLFLII